MLLADHKKFWNGKIGEVMAKAFEDSNILLLAFFGIRKAEFKLQGDSERSVGIVMIFVHEASSLPPPSDPLLIRSRHVSSKIIQGCLFQC